MATSTVPGHHETVKKNIFLDLISMQGSCPSNNFCKKFQDFFTSLNEDSDDLASMLEDKLIPRKQQETSESDSKSRRWSKRAFQRRSSEIEVRLHRTSLTGFQGHSSSDSPKSPTPSRRRSSSIAVARPTPDLHRFLQAEAGPWGHLSPSVKSPTRTPAISPLTVSSSSHLNPRTSPGGPSPTSPAGSVGGSTFTARMPGPRQYRGRTSSMPAVPRHRDDCTFRVLTYSTFTDAEQIDKLFRLVQAYLLATNNCTPYLVVYNQPLGYVPTVVEHPVYVTMLADTKSGGGSGAEDGTETEDGVEYYRLRSFSITANGVFNLGDSLKSRRSKSINSVTSSGTSCSSTREARLLSSASQISGMEAEEYMSNERVATYKVAMLGASGVGKTALTAQFTTSDYICAYDTSLDEEYGQKSVSVMLNGQETELEIIDHPAAEISVETFCSTYNPDVYVVVYSVVDRRSLKIAEETLLYLWKSDYMACRGVILVGNKVDLERKRQVPSVVGRRLANNCGCKFIETSSGLAHHVDELLVGILAQIKLNPQRDRDQATKRKRSKHRRRILKHLLGFKRKTKSCEDLFVL